MDNTSFWEDSSQIRINYPPLTSAIEVDVVIIGGGITGVSAAYELIKTGNTVAIIDAHKMGGVTTSHSTGNLYVPIQPLFQKVIKKFGLEQAKKVALSRTSAIDSIEKKVDEFKIECNFSRRPWYGYTSSSKQQTGVEKEIEAFKSLGFPVEEIKELPFDTMQVHKGFMLPNQARFNPLSYVLALTQALHKKGCFIYENTQAINITEEKRCTVTTPEGKLTAKAVIMATHTPVGISLTHFYTAPYRSYVMVVNPSNGELPEGNIWKLDNPYFALSTHAIKSSKPNRLFIAGRHHKTGQDLPMKAHFKGLQNFLKTHFPQFQEEYSWSAQHYHSADSLPYIGPASRFSNNIYMATGYFADGLIYGTIAAEILAALIIKKINRSVYSSTRFKPFASFKFVAQENMNVYKEYLKDLPYPQSPDFTKVKSGEGLVVEIDREKVAVSRDKNNTLHKVSAVCPHMKCIVSWNDAEQTWDCPCHGSRFKCNGDYIEGPALCGLKKIEG